MKNKENQTKTATQEAKSIEIALISTNPSQPRKVFSNEAILRLADSIKRYGIIQPLVVRPTAEGYELISGERRLRACKELEFSHVPCIVRESRESESAEIAIIENLLREDLNAFEEAEAIQALIDTYSLTQEEIAAKLSCSQSYIANKLRLLRLEKDLRETILKNKLTERHARALLKIKDKEEAKRILATIISNELNVTQTEDLIERHLLPKTAQEAKARQYHSTGAFFDAISRAIETANKSGIKIKSQRLECENHIQMTILIPTIKEEVEKQQENHKEAFSIAKEM